MITRSKMFAGVRKSALREWFNATGRKRAVHKSHFLHDDRVDAYECKWQRMAMAGQVSGLHICEFCSIGDSADWVSISLSNTRFDRLRFGEKKDSEFLFGFYSEFFLTAIGIIDDLYKLSLDMDFIPKNTRHAEARKTMSLGTEMNDFIQFVSETSKHKFGTRSCALHTYNNHLPKLFVDSGIQSTIDRSKIYSMRYYAQPSPQVDKSELEAIEMPSLGYAIRTVRKIYEFVDGKIRADKDAFKAYCDSKRPS